jgi:hypothetical protein
LRHYITGAPLKAKHKIAEKFNTYVFLFHQLSGKANDRSPSVSMHHTDAAESKSFAENLDFCLCVSTLNSDNRCGVDCTKHRRTGPKPSVVVQVDGNYNQVKDTDGVYIRDPLDGTIRLASEVHAVTSKKADVTAAAKKKASGKKHAPAELAVPEFDD